MIEYINDYISGEKFENFIKELNRNDIIYVNQFLIAYKFPRLDYKYILLTHNSDINLNNNIIASIGGIPENIIKWYAQNIDYNHDKLESIPIGLENGYNFPEIKKIDKMKKKLEENKSIKNLLYVNFDIRTNIKERLIPSKIFEDFKLATVKNLSNGQDFVSYIDNIYNHKFILCPQGNGIDTHRIWESLYMGSIPIVKRCSNTKYYEDLPICFINDWREINNIFLEKEYDRIINGKWNMEKLTMNYWKKEILKYENKI